jgi:hypothetical protein
MDRVNQSIVNLCANGRTDSTPVRSSELEAIKMACN